MPADPNEALTLRDRSTSIPSLELPNAPEFVSRPSRISLAQMLPLLEQYRQWFPPSEAMIALRARRRCDVEFIL